MATLVENALLLLIILVVYAYRPPQTHGNATTPLPLAQNVVEPQHGPNASTGPAVRNESRSPSRDPVLQPREATVFRATTPAGLPSDAPVQYRVAVKAEVDTENPITILSVLNRGQSARQYHR